MIFSLLQDTRINLISLVVCRLCGHTEPDTTEATWQQGTNLAPLGWIPVIPKHAVEL